MGGQVGLADYAARTGKTHFIFDFDATILLLDLPWEDWHAGVYAELTALDPDLYEQWATVRALSGIQNAFVEKHGDAALALLCAHNKRFESGFTAFHKNDGLLAEIEAIGTSAQRSIWSSNTRDVVEHVLELAELDGLFDKIVSRDNVRMLKPNPEGFALLHDPAVPKSRYVLVGDSSSDRGAAQAAGIDFYFTDFFNQGL
jgi:beta-phosphoglucomutase-like phosphatase (HAD superfamily)